MVGLLKVLSRAAVICFCILMPEAYAKTYYVALNGSDSNSGTIDAPFGTINKGARMLSAGDTLYIRGGTYHQTVYVGYSGAVGSPITVAGYPGEEVVIDGEYTLPTTTWGTLFLVDGSYVTIRDLIAKRSNWMGVVLKGHHDQALNIKSQLHMENGILVTGSGSYSVVEGCEVYSNCMSNEKYQNLRGGWASGLSAARGPSQVTLRRNQVWNNWGEGLSTYEAEYTVLEGNTVYDNKLNVYLSDTKHSILRSNLIYCTRGNVCYTVSQIGIALGDEKYNPPSSDNTIVNNLVLGNSKNLYYWPGVNGGGLVNVVIAFNTLVNSAVETNLKFLSGNHTNTWIGNNIVVQDYSLPLVTVSTSTGLTFSHNLWSRTPPSSASGSGDVVGDPQLLKRGTTEAGQLSPDYFLIPATSPAKSAAQYMPDFLVDFFGKTRDANPDIGACEARLQPPISVKVLSLLP